MKNSIRLKQITVSILLQTLTICAFAASGGSAGGGGGMKEPLFQEIALNISRWITSGNADQIQEYLTPYGLNKEDYKREMSKVLANYHIQFTDDKVLVNKKEKTCRGYVDTKGVNQIICNNTQFGSDKPADINEIYRQVHHEFASLSCWKKNNVQNCIEQNKNEDSDYRISNHVSGYLRSEVVMRLPIMSKDPKAYNAVCTYKDDLVRKDTPNGESVFTQVSFTKGDSEDLFAPNPDVLLKARISISEDNGMYLGRLVRIVGETNDNSFGFSTDYVPLTSLLHFEIYINSDGTPYSGTRVQIDCVPM